MKRRYSLMCSVMVPIAASACATLPKLGETPDYTTVQTIPSVRARLYADCLAQSAADGRYGYAYDDLHVVVFTCEGTSARVFFEALGSWSSAVGSEVVVGDRTIRSTVRIERDLFAADYCERSSGTFRCAITLRTGEFTRPDVSAIGVN